MEEQNQSTCQNMQHDGSSFNFHLTNIANDPQSQENECVKSNADDQSFPAHKNQTVPLIKCTQHSTKPNGDQLNSTKGKQSLNNS